MYDVWKIRNEFPLLRKNPKLIYLDSAATSQKPDLVIDTMTHFLQEENGTVHRAIYSLAASATSRYNEVRTLVREFIGAKEDSEIIFTRGTTEGINLVASSFGRTFVEEGDEIIISETEHHSNIIPWQFLCEEKKAHLKVVPVDETGKIRLDIFEKMLSLKTRLVSIAHVSNATGATQFIEEIIALSHKKGAKVLLDAAQSICHIPINVEKLDVDFLVFSGHKLYGPTGIGILYGKKDLLEKMPPSQGGGDMIEQVTFEKTTFQKIPLKFEAGTPNIVGVIGLGAAITWMQKVGVEEIAAHEAVLFDIAFSELKKIKEVHFLTLSEEKSSMITFYCKGVHSLDIGTLLDTKSIALRTGHLCAQPALKRFGISSAVRISFGAYNTEEEVHQFIKSLKEVLLLLK